MKNNLYFPSFRSVYSDYFGVSFDGQEHTVFKKKKVIYQGKQTS